MRVLEWNIEHALFKHERELKSILSKNKVDLAILTETDGENIRGNFNLPGFKTFYPVPPIKTTNSKPEKIRIICLARDGPDISFEMRLDMMSRDTPMIWIEARTHTGMKFLIGGVVL